MGMPPVITPFALKEEGAGVLVACPDSAVMARCSDVVVIELSIVNLIEDFNKGGVEARPSLFLKLQIREGFRGPMDEVLSQQEVAAMPLSVLMAQRAVGEGVVTDRRDAVDR